MHDLALHCEVNCLRSKDAHKQTQVNPCSDCNVSIDQLISTWTVVFFIPGLTSFSEITKDAEAASKMKDLYQDIDNIDLWVGGLAEDHESGSELGPTFRT